MDNLTPSHNNNFDLLRFVAASLVIFSHSFPLSGNKNEPFSALSNNQMTMGSLAVAVFFVVSGYLVTMSYDNSSTIYTFFMKRCLRIFPGLAVVTILTALVVGPVFSTHASGQYFLSSSTYTYLFNILLFDIQLGLPCVFRSNPHPDTVNGSIWTLWYEFVCYLLLMLLGSTRLLNWKVLATGIVIAIPAVFLNWDVLPLFWRFHINSFLTPIREYSTYIVFITYFMSGALIYLLRHIIRLTGTFAGIACLVLVLSFFFGGFNSVFIFAGSYLLIYLANCSWIPASAFAKHGDFSYGIYIYAFPVQQMMAIALGHENVWYTNALFSFPIVLMLAYFSWHFIEKPALLLKKRIGACVA